KKTLTCFDFLNCDKKTIHKEIEKIDCDMIKIMDNELSAQNMYLVVSQIYLMLLSKAGYGGYNFSVLNGRCIWFNQITTRRMKHKKFNKKFSENGLRWSYNNGRRSLKKKLHVVT